MVAVQNIELKKEYTVTKITGRWGMRRRIQRLGIEAGKKIIFHSHSRSGLYTFSFSDSKKKRKLPGANLNFIKLTASNDPSLSQ
ncbi:MAG: hypothetical protein PHE56_08025 [Bacteroidales bacterium]|nr:hypothetical protein [Bacteroidales bacterium]